MSIHPDRATRLTRFAALGVVGATVFAVGVFLVPLPAPDISADPVTGTGPAETPTSDEGDSEEAAVAWVELASVMDEIKPFEHRAESVAVVPEQPPEELPEEVSAQNDPSQVPRGVPGWRYVGSVDVGGTLNAVVMVESRQHFASVGDVIEGFEIVEVDEQHVDIQSNTQPRRRVDREQAIRPQLQASGRIPTRPGSRPVTDPLEDPEERLERLRQERDRSRGGDQ